MNKSENRGENTAALTITAIGGPTVILEVGGLRLITDPTFDPPSEYPVGRGYSLVKTRGPAIAPDQVGPLDAVLLSHDQHPDNLDLAGRDLLSTAAMVVSTRSASDRLGTPSLPLSAWESVALQRPDGGELLVIALPALHGPEGCEGTLGEVIGFMLTGEGLPTIYVSGDNASLEAVRDIRDHFGSADVGILNAGAARTPLLGDANLTLSGAMAVEVTELLRLEHAVVVHIDGWKHFSEGPSAVEEAFRASGLADRLVLHPPGLRAEIAVTGRGDGRLGPVGRRLGSRPT